jgi:N-acetylglucosamine kinase-like BadF-type ATPase
MNAADLILGIDGGGTKTVALLAKASEQGGPTVIARGSSGASNPRSVGFELAAAALNAAVAAAFHAAGIPPGTVAAACLGLAGAGRESERRELQSWADARRLAARFVQVHDALPVLAAGAPDLCGIALIGGTGSLAFGRNQAGDSARCGGWGYLFGDEGSGYSLAREALRAVAHEADGRGPATSLTERLLSRLRISRAENLVEAIYHADVDRATVASLADLVLEAARAHDPVAIALVDRAAGDLAEMVVAVAARLRFGEEPFPLALTGGLLLAGQDVLTTRIDGHLRRRRVDVQAWNYVSEPAVGALRLASIALIDQEILTTG